MNPFFINSALIFDHFEAMTRAHERMFDMMHNRMLREVDSTSLHRNPHSFRHGSNRENATTLKAIPSESRRGSSSFIENRAEERISRSVSRRHTRRQDTLAREGIKPLSSHSDGKSDSSKSRGLGKSYRRRPGNDGPLFSSKTHLGQGWYLTTNSDSGSISFRGVQILLESMNGYSFLSLYNPGKQGNQPKSWSFQFKLLPQSEHMITIVIGYQSSTSFFLLVLDLLQKTVSMYYLTSIPISFQSLCKNTHPIWQDSLTNNSSLSLVNHRFYSCQLHLSPSRLSITINNMIVYEKEDYEGMIRDAIDKEASESSSSTNSILDGYLGIFLFPKQQLYLKEVELRSSSSPILPSSSLPTTTTTTTTTTTIATSSHSSPTKMNKESSITKVIHDGKSKSECPTREDPLSSKNLPLLMYEDKKSQNSLQQLRQQLLQRHYDPHLIDLILQDVFAESTSVTFNDIAGLTEPKRILEEVVLLPFVLPELFTGMCQPWKGVLLFGPAGTGKTLLAKAIANVHHCTFFNCSTATLISKWRGESEKLIKCLFEAARLASPSILFFDEIDALVTSRGQENEHEASRRMKTEILSQIDGLQSIGGVNSYSNGSNESKKVPQVCVLATTNCPWDLDTAMLRRLEKRIYIPLPDEESRKQHFELCMKAMNIQFEGKEDSLSFAGETEERKEDKEDLINTLVKKTQGYSGADIVLVCRETAMIPMRKLLATHSMVDIQQKRVNGDLSIPPISSEDFEEALKKTKPTIVQDIVEKYENWNKIYGSSDS